jgi:zinc and cadmium transporter
MLIYILAATLLVSAISLVSVLLLSLRRSVLTNLLEYLVALSAGAMMGTVFLHLLPESIEFIDPQTAFLVVLISFIVFFLIEKFIHWHHHDTEDHKHSIGHMNLTGDAIHNFTDGVVIAGAFLVDFNLGIVTSIAVALHELPQEIGDFAILLHSGWERKKAVLANIAVSLTMVLGGIAGYFLVTGMETVLPYLTAFAAGGFLYIAASDLVPEIKHQESSVKSILHVLAFLAGIVLVFFL